MPEKALNTDFENLPPSAADFIKLVIKKIRYRKKVRAEVRAELIAHFEDELANCKTNDERNLKAKNLIEQFGDPALLAVLMRRAKKRCRPLWQKCLIRTAKVVGLVLLFIIIRVVYLTAGSANISINYIDWLNERVAVKAPETQNAKPDYDWAGELRLVMPREIWEKTLFDQMRRRNIDVKDWFSDFNDYEMKTFQDWLANCKDSIEALRQGSQKPYYWTVYQLDQSIPIQGSLEQSVSPMLSRYRQATYALGWQIVYDASKGRVADAMNNSIALQRFGRHLQGKGLLTEQMVGIAIEALAINRTSVLLAKLDIPAEVLRDFHACLIKDFKTPGPIFNLDAEKVFWYDLVQRGFTDDGKGGGRVLRNGLPLVVKDAPSALTGFFLWNYPDRRQVVSMIDKYFDDAAELMRQMPGQLYRDNRLSEWDELGKDCYMLLMIGPSHSRIDNLLWRLQTGRNSFLTITALKLYQKEKSNYPSSLEDLLKQGYLQKLPLDPFSGKPLVYKKTDESFLLYSVGSNFTDDGGEITYFTEGKRKGRVKKFADQGDWVYWPAP